MEAILGMKVNKDSFTRFGDKNNITNSLARTWFAVKDKFGRAKDNNKDLDLIAQNLSEEFGIEISPQDIVDFITSNPNGLRKTTDNSKALKSWYRELTGKSIDRHNDKVKPKKKYRGEKEEAKPNKGFRAGNLKDKAEEAGKFSATKRSTGHFGTGFYFFGKKSGCG